jgi:hypothetical protein
MPLRCGPHCASLPESQSELEDGSAGEALGHSNAQVRVGDIIPWEIYTDSR